ncbi:MAG: lipopolysaccharide biosynthesis protein [Burkholderiales bacterium]
MAVGGARTNLPDLIAPLLSRVGQLAAAFATIKISTTLLSPAEVGSVNQLNSSAMLLATGLLLPVIAYFTRGVSGWVGTNRFEAHARTVLQFIALTAVALSAAGALLQWGWGFVQDVGVPWVGVLLLAYLIGFPTHNLIISCTAVLGQRQHTALYSNLAAWLGLAAAVVLYFQFKTAEAWFLGICVGFLATALAFRIVLGKIKRSSTTGQKPPGNALPFDTMAVLRFMWPQVLVGTLWWIQSQSYRFQLAEISSLATVGLFFAGYALCSVPMQAFEAAVNEYYLPMLYGKPVVGPQNSVVHTWNLYAAVFVPSILVFGGFLAACAPFLVVLALGAEFQAVGAILLWAALSETARSLSTVNHAMGIAKVDMRRLLPPALAGALAAPALIQVLAPDEPLVGTAIALCLANAIVLVVVYVLVRLSAPVTWPWKRTLAAATLAAAVTLVGRAAFDLLPRTPVVALAVCAVLGLFVLVVLYYISRSSLAAVTAQP